LRDLIVAAIASVGSYSNDAKPLTWEEIKATVRAGFGCLPIVQRPSDAFTDCALPATRELGHWIRAMSDGGHLEHVPVAALRTHLIQVGRSSPMDLDGLMYLHFADAEPLKAHRDFFLDGWRDRVWLRNRVDSLRPEMKPEEPEAVQSPELLDYMKRNDAYARQLLKLVPHDQHLQANNMFAWMRNFGFSAPQASGGQPQIWGQVITTANVTAWNGQKEPAWLADLFALLKQAKSPVVANVDAQHMMEYLMKNKRFEASELRPRYRHVSPDEGDSITFEQEPLSRSVRHGEKNLIFVRRADPDDKGIYLPLHEALPLMFPFCFPLGWMPKLNGTTLRQQARALLKIIRDGASWIGLTNFVGSVASSLHLFLFAIIEEGRVDYRISMEKLNSTSADGTCSVRELSNIHLPTMEAYWRLLRMDARGVCAKHGAPGLMLTFTGNERDLPDDLKAEIENLGFSVAGPDAAPIRAEYWARQFEALRRRNWSDWCREAGLPKPVGHIFRAEGQERGALHAHVCLHWKRELTKDELDRVASGRFPPKGTTAFQLVKALHIHRHGERCKSVKPDPVTGLVRETCCWGFPKGERDDHEENGGWHEMPRTAEDAMVAEWLQTTLMDINAHSHCRIIGKSEGADGAVSYVLDYCLKREAVTRYVDTTSDVSKVLSTRAVSLSLASYMMFSHTMASVSEKVHSIRESVRGSMPSLQNCRRHSPAKPVTSRMRRSSSRSTNSSTSSPTTRQTPRRESSWRSSSHRRQPSSGRLSRGSSSASRTPASSRT
jgi:hypothetical protein